MQNSLFFLTLVCLPLLSFAQKRNSVVLEAKLIQGISKLIENNQTVPLAELNEQLKQAVGKKVKIPKVPSFVFDPRSLYELCKPSTLIVSKLYKCGRCTHWHSGSATGFPLTRDGVFATNYHVAAQTDGQTLAVVDGEGKIYPVTEVLAGDKDSDVAILRSAGAEFRPLPLGQSAQIGSSVHVISHPDGMFYYYSKGMVSLYDGIKGSASRLTEWMVISADYARGSSGAAVLNDSGEVVGMVASTHTILYNRDQSDHPQMVARFCVPVEAIRRLIE
jgi:S1-C subfamily serine protease